MCFLFVVSIQLCNDGFESRSVHFRRVFGVLRGVPRVLSALVSPTTAVRDMKQAATSIAVEFERNAARTTTPAELAAFIDVVRK